MTDIVIVYSSVQTLVVVLDCSPSMDMPLHPSSNAPIYDLNEALRQLYKDLLGVKHSRIDIAHIRFAGHAVVERPFEPITSSTPPVLQVFGSGTDYSAALTLAMREAEEHRAVVRASGLEANQPWIVFISDGGANLTSCPGYENELIRAIESDKLLFIPVAVGGGETYEALAAISPRIPPFVVNSADLADDSLSFADFFRWLSDSMEAGKLVDRHDTEDDDLG